MLFVEGRALEINIVHVEELRKSISINRWFCIMKHHYRVGLASKQAAGNEKQVKASKQ